MTLFDLGYASKLDCELKRFKFKALKEHIVRNEQEFSDRVAFDISPAEGSITWLVLKPGKQHARHPSGGYDASAYDAYRLSK